MLDAAVSSAPGSEVADDRAVTETVLYPPRVLSGVQPTAGVHLGHYFGALRQHIQLHHRYPGQTFILIADYHLLTRQRDPAAIRTNTIELATTYLALGLDPLKATLFRQSDVPQCTELAWILSCLTPNGELRRVPSYKAMIENENASSDTLGLLSYPVLMAADIFSVRATIIPVGKDQKPNVEAVRDIARRFNNAYSTDYLPLPEIRLTENHSVPGIDGRKMSTAYDNHILLFERFDQLKEKIKRIPTASVGRYEPKSPDSCNVMALYRLVAEPARLASLQRRYLEGSVDFVDAKRELVLAIQEYFAPYLDRYSDLKRRPDFVADVLREGFREASEQAHETLDEVRRIVGLAAA